MWCVSHPGAAGRPPEGYRSEDAARRRADELVALGARQACYWEIDDEGPEVPREATGGDLRAERGASGLGDRQGCESATEAQGGSAA